MARLTRNSYKRKIILFAVFVFISIFLFNLYFKKNKKTEN